MRKLVHYPAARSNYIDEASLKMTDLGPAVLRALVLATGQNQNVNVTALTELAALKVGLEAGQTNPATVEDLSEARVNNANNAVGGFFKVDPIAGEVVPTATLNGRGQGSVNPGFSNAISNAASNYGAALKAISNLVALDGKAYPTQADALRKLADNLQFVDGDSGSLKWATNARGQSLASSNLMQAHLFAEPLQQIIQDPNSSPAAVEAAQARFSALATNAVNGTRAATAELVQGIVDSVNKVLGLADGRANVPTVQPTLDDYRVLGADISGLGSSTVKTDYLSLLNSVIDPLSADKADTPAEILALANTVVKVIDSAAGRAGNAPSRGELEQLGVSGLNDRDLPAVLRALQKLPADRLSGITTLPGLQALADKAIAAQDRIRDYAGDNTLAAPTAQDYADIGVSLPSTPQAVADTILTATNKALASGPVGPGQAGTPERVQLIVNSYARLLALADGSLNSASGDLPVVQDYVNVGMDKALTDKLDAPRLSLLNQLVDRAANPGAVASPASLEALATLANKVLDTAAQQSGDSIPAHAHLSAADFVALGVDGLSAVENEAVIAALQAKSPVEVDTLAEIQSVAAAARAAIGKIVAFADKNGGDAPTVADYLAVGVSGISDVGPAANKDIINAALATSAVDGARVSAVARLQGLVNSYLGLLAQADGQPGNTADARLAKEADFRNIGVDLDGITALDSGAAGSAANIVQLLSSLIDSRSAADIDSPAKVQAYAALAGKVGLAVQGNNSNPLTVEEFARMKITGINAGNLAKVLAQLARQPDDGSTVNTWAKLADAVFTVTNVPALNTVAGDDTINLVERLAGVTLSGTAGKDDTVTLFAPDGSVMKSGIVTRDAGTGTSVWNWSYTLTESDWRALGADGANGVDKTISIQSRNVVKGIDSIKVNYPIRLDTTIPVFSKPIRLEQDTGTSGSDGTTSNGKILVEGLEPGATWTYKVDDGAWQPGSNGAFDVTGEGSHVVKVRQTDRAGNDSAEQSLMPGGELLLQLHRALTVDLNWLLTGGEPEVLPQERDEDVRQLVEHYHRADMQGREIIRMLAHHASQDEA